MYASPGKGVCTVITISSFNEALMMLFSPQGPRGSLYYQCRCWYTVSNTKLLIHVYSYYNLVLIIETNTFLLRLCSSAQRYFEVYEELQVLCYQVFGNFAYSLH